MTTERLSKLQKWIIKECFNVSVLLDRGNLKELRGAKICKSCNKDKPIKKRDCNNSIYIYCDIPTYNHCNKYRFYREDILLSYFDLTVDHSIEPYDKVEHFRGNPDNNKAYVSLTRTLKNLEDKDYVVVYWIQGVPSMSRWIVLTDKGKEKALELLNLDNEVIKEPPLIKEDKQRELKEKAAEKRRRLENILRMG